MGQSSRDTSSNLRRENTQSESQQQQNASAAPEFTSQQKEAVDKYVLISVVTGPMPLISFLNGILVYVRSRKFYNYFNGGV